ncbi:MAG: hypothetical protein OSA98_02700 [Rubripirellula sp.]|nr:hypothetical protein [Rubripirellula sp.]
MRDATAPDRRNRKWWFRPLFIVFACLVVVIAFALMPRYQLQLVTVDDAHQWSGSESPPQRQIVWQPATPFAPVGNEVPLAESRIRPQITDNGNVLFFTARSDDDQYGIMRSEQVDGQWTVPEAVDELNSPSNDIGPVVRADGQILYLYSDRDGGFGGMDLYVSLRDGDRWSKPINLGARINSPSHEYDPAISPDGSRLYFSSNRSDAINRQMASEQYDSQSDHWTTTLRTDLGNRTFDLYVSHLDDATKEWNHASPLTSLNTTQYNEGSPFVSSDGASLIFVSDRPERHGESQNYDIYRARIVDGPLTAENLGIGINSSANEVEPALAKAGFQIVFSRSIDQESIRYGLFQSTAKEVLRTAQWESSRWQAFSAAVVSTFKQLFQRFWWILCVLALLALAIWLIRQMTIRRIAIPGFLIAAITIHFLLVTSSFYVFFQEEISYRLHKMFEEETVLASEVLFPSSAPNLEKQPKFDQVADLEMPESVDPIEVSKQVTESVQTNVQPVELAMPQMPVRITGDLPSDAVVATVFVPPKPDDQERKLTRRTTQSALVSPDRVVLEQTVAVNPLQAKPIESINPEVQVQDIDITHDEVHPIQVTVNQPESLLTAEESDLQPDFQSDLMTTRFESEAILINRDETSRVPEQTTDETIATEMIAVKNAVDQVSQKSVSIDLPLSREMTEPTIAQLKPTELLSENRSAPAAMSEETLPQPFVLAVGMESLAVNRSPAAATLQRAGHSRRQSDHPSESLRIVVPVGTGQSVTEATPPKLASLDVARRSMQDAVVNLVPPGSAEAKSMQQTTSPLPAKDLPVELPSTIAAIPVSLPNRLPNRRSLKASDAYADTNVNLRSLLQRRRLDPAMKSEIVKEFGGNDETLAAIREGLSWIEQHQHADGHWGLHNFHENCQGHERCNGGGGSQSDTAGTGLALLPFLGDGETHKQGAHKDLVGRGITWLVTHQKPDGDLFTGGQDIARMYSHGIATIALCECYGMSGDASLRGPAQRAIDFIVDAQDPKTGGWRYRPRDGGDTSVLGWQVMALKSGQMAELNVPQNTLREAERWLQSIAGKGGRMGQFAYQAGRFNPAMTAESLLCLEYLGAEHDEDQVRHAADFLLANTPQKDRESSYFWYYGTQAMFHLQGEHWKKWNSVLHPLLIESQQKEGPTSGTWDAKDQWERSGGRIYSTSLRLLMLEVYYRHLPLYRVIR